MLYLGKLYHQTGYTSVNRDIRALCLLVSAIAPPLLLTGGRDFSTQLLCRALGFHWAVYTEKVYTGVVSLSQVSEVPDMSVLLFGGAVTSERLSSQTYSMEMNEGWIKFSAPQDTAEVVLRTRACMEELLAAKLANTGVDLTRAAEPIVKAVLELLWWEDPAAK
jgi:hypothetical protein